ncbi:MAG: carbamate kinase [Moorellaceae bacterium]
MQTLVLALGGNAITKAGERGTFPEQLRNIAQAVDSLAELVVAGYKVLITHGNGPQVGNLLIKNELAKHVVPPMPLDVCVANTQGSLGYGIQQQLRNALQERGWQKEVVTFVTQVVVDPHDPAFRHPTKPVGPFYTAEEARELEKSKGYHLVEDSGRGWRRVVASPRPLEIVEKLAIRKALDEGVIVIAAGGGGIPVIRDAKGRLTGVEGVIDKDLAAARLALDVQADVLLILTGVRKVALNFGRPGQRELDLMTLEEARRYLAEGHFPPGSMGPKVEAAMAFLEQGGQRAIIGLLEEAREALQGRAGTTIVPGS